MNLKPITTFYKGYKFRSRLEARWAVFFAELGMQFEYESEGYQFGGDYYLPDFYLPDIGVFVEVKGKNDFFNNPMPIIKLASEFRHAGSGHAIMLVVGDPVDNLSFLFCYTATEEKCAASNYAGVSVVQKGIIIPTTKRAHYLTGGLFVSSAVREIPAFAYFLKSSEALRTKAQVAAIKARQAQFEHGKHGT